RCAGFLLSNVGTLRANGTVLAQCWRHGRLGSPMEMDLDFSQDMSGSQTLRVSPHLVAASYILELSSQELQQQIANELNDNPALELVDVPTCSACGSELQGKVCPWCIQRQRSEDTPRDSGEDLNASMYDDPPPPSSQRLTDEEFDP